MGKHSTYHEQFKTSLGIAYSEALAASNAEHANLAVIANLVAYQKAIITITPKGSLYPQPRIRDRIKSALSPLVTGKSILIPSSVRSGPQPWAEVAMCTENAFVEPVDVYHGYYDEYNDIDFPLKGPIKTPGKPRFFPITGEISHAAMVGNSLRLLIEQTADRNMPLSRFVVANAVAPLESGRAGLHIDVLTLTRPCS
jgi:hypothetical protein